MEEEEKGKVVTAQEWETSNDSWDLCRQIWGSRVVLLPLSISLKLSPEVRSTPGPFQGKFSERKARLYAVACCRLIKEFMTTPNCFLAVDLAEAVADRKAPKANLIAMRREFKAATRDKLRRSAPNPVLWAGAWDAARSALRSSPWDAATECQHACFVTLRVLNGTAAAGVALCRAIRDIFGNPFRPVTLDPRWRTADVLDLARAIYEDRAFERMPILADALMDAGCDNADIINHCRGGGPHVRGCWVVDLVLGKE